MEVLNLCLSDIDKSKIFESKNGKKYLSVVVTERKEVDQYGNDLVVYVSQSKEEREQGQRKNYIGSGKTYGEKPTPAQPQEPKTETKPTPDPTEEMGDLPF